MNIDELKLELMEFIKWNNADNSERIVPKCCIESYLNSYQFLKRNELRAIDSNSGQQLKEVCPVCGGNGWYEEVYGGMSVYQDCKCKGQTV